MKNIIAFLLIIGIFSCQQRKPRIESVDTENLTTEQIDSILTEFKFQYVSPIAIDSTDHVLIPISTELLERRSKFSKDGYYSDDYPRYWNILFYNRKTGETQLLTEEKIRISMIHATPDEYDTGTKIMNNKILYEIGNIDFNRDQKLNYKDPEFLFSSDIDGTNLLRISPPDEDLQYFEVIPNSNEILIRTLRDINKDKIFDREDESIWYNAKWEKQNWKLTEIIDEVGRKRIENLYFEQWLKKK